jgi:hypothetical protein
VESSQQRWLAKLVARLCVATRTAAIYFQIKIRQLIKFSKRKDKKGMVFVQKKKKTVGMEKEKIKKIKLHNYDFKWLNMIFFT